MLIRKIIFNIKLELKCLVYRVMYILKREGKLRCKYCNSIRIKLHDYVDVTEDDKTRRYTEGVCKKCGAELVLREIWTSREEIEKILEERKNIKLN